MTTQLAIAGDRPYSIGPADLEGFDFSHLRSFRGIPSNDDFDVVAMHGIVVVVDRLALRIGGIRTGRLYVRENQRPAAGLEWERWLSSEWEYRDRCQPFNRLRTRREVVQAIEHPRGGKALRLASGFVDGPYHEWAYGADLIGEVVGVYLPGAAGSMAPTK